MMTAGEVSEESTEARLPKYYGPKQAVLEMAERLAPGSLLPAERELANQFGTSRTTVRQALTELVAEGRLRRVHGRGTFVAAPKLAMPLALMGYSESMRALGLVPTSKLLGIRYLTAGADLARRLDTRAGDRILRMERLRMTDEEPMAIEATHLAVSRFPGLRQHLLRNPSLYAVLEEKYQVTPVEAEETIETAPVPAREAGLLGMDIGIPVLLLTRHTLDAAGAPIEFVTSMYRGDRYKLVATLRREGRSAVDRQL
jgi:GntR family transcriptional regulator